jgi:hypothetical protein
MPCNSSGMDLVEPSGKATAGDHLSTGRPAYHFLAVAYFFSRPILIGVLALLASVVCCRMYSQAVSTSYNAPSYSDSAAHSSNPRTIQKDGQNSPEENALPLLFLSFVGLAGMALSRTRPSDNARE